MFQDSRVTSVSSKTQQIRTDGLRCRDCTSLTRAFRRSPRRVDTERGVWTIPPESSKTGEVTGEAHVEPLSAGTRAILKARRDRKGAPLSPYVFPAPSGGHLRHPVRGIATVRERSGVLDLRLDEVRRTVSQRIADEFGEGMSRSIFGHAGQRLGLTYIPSRPLKEQRDASSGERLAGPSTEGGDEPRALDPADRQRGGISRCGFG
jgi:hypothetical protein